MRGRRRTFRLLLLVLVVGTAYAQTAGFRRGVATPDWRQIGNSAIEASLASLASGPVDRVWFSQDGSRLFARTRSGRVLETADFENWLPSSTIVAPPPAAVSPAPQPPSLPEAGAGIRLPESRRAVLYALGHAVYRSDDEGHSWTNLTDYRRHSILGGGLTDLAISPQNPEEIVAAGLYGVWRSMDGGFSWTGLNHSMPNLPVRRLLRLPGDGQETRILLEEFGEWEWAPGEKLGWRPAKRTETAGEAALRETLSRSIGAEVLSVATALDYIYAGGRGGRLWASSDRGRTWLAFQAAEAGPVEGLFVDVGEPRLALAAIGERPAAGVGPRVFRTVNGGLFWDDLTTNLPDAAAHAVTADRESGSVYVATDAGVFHTFADLVSAGPATQWRRVTGNLPNARVWDVQLDSEANQLYVALEGAGVFAAMAPHRMLDPRVVNAANWRASAASPGALLSVLGPRIEAARAGNLEVPVLASSDTESQIQVPFEATGPSLLLALTAAVADFRGTYTVGLPLRDAAPAIFVDRDGTPMLLDADSGVLLDAMTPARSGARLQILATGLGKVRPDWPTGLAAPLESPPQVVAPVRAYVDRMPVEVTRATLAPGYVGFYLVEIRMPEIVNAGPAEIYIEMVGQQSNKARVYLEP